MADIAKLDLYGILGVSPEATEKEILKAYRKKALKCHPDKNPDNPDAASLFHELSKALEVLTDAAARAAYDKILKARAAAEARHQVLDSKRKKFKEDLEERERAFANREVKIDQRTAAQKLEEEIKRLRKEGSSLLEEEKERMKQELAKDNQQDSEDEQKVLPRLKVKWKASKGDDTNGGYSKQYLETLFNKYGEISILLVSKKKNGSAILEFFSAHSALMAVQNEIGLPSNPLTLTWLQGEPPATIPVSTYGAATRDSPTAPTFPCFTDDNTNESSQSSFDPLTSDDRDFESIVLMRMRQAQERKKLIEEMEKDVGEETIRYPENTEQFTSKEKE